MIHSNCVRRIISYFPFNLKLKNKMDSIISHCVCVCVPDGIAVDALNVDGANKNRFFICFSPGIFLPFFFLLSSSSSSSSSGWSECGKRRWFCNGHNSSNCRCAAAGDAVCHWWWCGKCAVILNYHFLSIYCDVDTITLCLYLAGTAINLHSVPL